MGRWRRPADPVPTCPAWTLADLVDHIGSTQRCVNWLVADGVSDRGTAFSIGWEQAPAEPSAWPMWLLDGADGVAATFASTTDGRELFDPSSGGNGIGFWFRRIYGEIAVHRIDAAESCAVLGDRDEPIHLIDQMNWDAA